MSVNVENDLLYETDERGQRVLVRSMESNRHAYIRFTNRTSRPVDVWWRNFQGKRRHYVRLTSKTYFDINTFITHPWEFTDAATKERYVINNQPIFRPPPNIGGMMYRTNWNITVSVRSLRYTALHSVATLLSDPCEVQHLNLPKVLAEDLEALTSFMTTVPNHRSDNASQGQY